MAKMALMITMALIAPMATITLMALMSRMALMATIALMALMSRMAPMAREVRLSRGPPRCPGQLVPDRCEGRCSYSVLDLSPPSHSAPGLRL